MQLKGAFMRKKLFLMASIFLLLGIITPSVNFGASSFVWASTYYDEYCGNWSKTTSSNGGTIVYGQNTSAIDESNTNFKRNTSRDYAAVTKKPRTGNVYGHYKDNGAVSYSNVHFVPGNQGHGSNVKS